MTTGWVVCTGPLPPDYIRDAIWLYTTFIGKMMLGLYINLTYDNTRGGLNTAHTGNWNSTVTYWYSATKRDAIYTGSNTNRECLSYGEIGYGISRGGINAGHFGTSIGPTYWTVATIM